jgi:tripartite-type tricarboxylate transporter receptor subunit TctC
MQQNQYETRRRSLFKLAAAGAAASVLPTRAQSEFPKGPVRFIVPLAAGGVADVATRIMTPALEKIWGQPVIVDNRPGGMFALGINAILQAPADGHTLIYLFNSMATIQVVHKKFDINTQLSPITQSTVCPMVLMVGASSRFRTLGELVAYGKANSGKLTYASLGPGSIEHLKAVQLEKIAGYKAINVPYKSGPDMVKDVLGGMVDYVLTIGSFGAMYGPSGKARVLGVFDSNRMKVLPDVPTIEESGFGVPSLSFWGGYAAHGNTPSDIIRRLHRDISQVASSKAVAEKIAQMTLTPVVSSEPAHFRQTISSDLAWMTEVVRDMDKMQFS